MEGMKVGIVGLGRMGAGLAARAMKRGYSVSGYDPNITAQKEAEKNTIALYHDIESLARAVEVVWLMVPAGKPVDDALLEIKRADKKDLIIVDGGNSHFPDSQRRAKEVALTGNHFIDCGVSGGVHGLTDGFCLMVGGEFKIYERLEPLLKVLAAPGGFAYVGPSGAGHYVKMIHNGIEYGMLQAYAEGFQLLREGDYKDLDLEKIANLWMHGAVIRSWLLELTHNVLKEDQNLGSIDGKIAQGGTGAWTVQNGKKNNIPLPVIEKSLEVREQSQKSGGNFATKLIQMIRNQFGGHPIVRKPGNEL